MKLGGVRNVPGSPKSSTVADLLALTKVAGGPNGDSAMQKMLKDLQDAAFHNEEMIAQANITLAEIKKRESELEKREQALKEAKAEFDPLVNEFAALLPTFNSTLEEVANG